MLEEIADLIANTQRLLGQIPRLCDEDRDDNEWSGIQDQFDEGMAELAEAANKMERVLRPTPPTAAIPFDQATDLRVMTEERPVT